LFSFTPSSAEGTGDILALLYWVAFGAVVVGQSIESFSEQIPVYALLSLTVVRTLPVFLVLRFICNTPSP